MWVAAVEIENNDTLVGQAHSGADKQRQMETEKRTSSSSNSNASQDATGASSRLRRRVCGGAASVCAKNVPRRPLAKLIIGAAAVGDGGR